MQQYRVLIALGALAALIIIAFVVVRGEPGEETPEGQTSIEDALPAIDEEDITEFIVRRPGEEPTRIAKRDGVWRVVEPVDAASNESAVTTALEKLASLEVLQRAATRAESHERLLVDGENGIRVTVKNGDETIADLIIGDFRGGNTMIRRADKDEVWAVEGSIKFAFNKSLSDWRDKQALEVEADHVAAVTFENSDGVAYNFVRTGEDWGLAEGQAEIERFSPSKVQTIIRGIANMRAVDFGPPDLSLADAGLAEPRARVRLTVRTPVEADPPPPPPEGEEPPPPPAPTEFTESTHVILLGAAREGDREAYAMIEGDDTIYVISQYIAEKLRPALEDLQNPEPAAEGEEGSEEPEEEGAPPGEGGEIPPEMMEQIRRQLEAQGVQAPPPH